ncbi:DUF742 domain-containing protein [Streptomyces sp. NPDC017979]|uniref:DUF742 domain-containing protein n=1 Tax=Streptomyces sp. NPDC017979 TaxID=3365024 RepID=UPI00379FE3C3
MLTGLVRPERTGGAQESDGPPAADGDGAAGRPGAGPASPAAPAGLAGRAGPGGREALQDAYDPENFVPLPPGARATPAPSGPPAPVAASAPVPAPAPVPVSVPASGPAVPADLPAAQLSLLTALDGGSLTVVEAAALLELPVSAVRVLAAHLIDRGLVRSRPPVPYAAQPPSDLLERVADGLRALKL